jgi:hypothetical protein
MYRNTLPLQVRPLTFNELEFEKKTGEFEVEPF